MNCSELIITIVFFSQYCPGTLFIATGDEIAKNTHYLEI